MLDYYNLHMYQLVQEVNIKMVIFVLHVTNLAQHAMEALQINVFHVFLENSYSKENVWITAQLHMQMAINVLYVMLRYQIVIQFNHLVRPDSFHFKDRVFHYVQEIHSKMEQNVQFVTYHVLRVMDLFHKVAIHA